MTNLPVPSPGQAITGVDLTAAFWNANVKDAINFLCNPPLLVAQDNGTNTTSFTAGVAKIVALGTTVADTYAGWSAVNNTYTAQVAGFYQISGGVTLSTVASAGYCLTEVYYNGAVIANSQLEQLCATSATQGSFIQPVRTVHQFLNVGDTISLVCQVQQGSIKTQPTSSLEIRWVHT